MFSIIVLMETYHSKLLYDFYCKYVSIHVFCLSIFIFSISHILVESPFFLSISFFRFNNFVIWCSLYMVSSHHFLFSLSLNSLLLRYLEFRLYVENVDNNSYNITATKS